ncbi:hypothetical protein OV079_51520 [Nannocystis pusilla]|uniref:Uncharacterized protein n=1 Tax=Nannocystis pusilla TaxID=889268 RepID=A0A9X3F9F1_9BACT|nr:hypothetical protein [Nannocystis pusilla]MCY1013821.1 hypothetical protein [Nannocystis pusilla]
MPSLAKLADTAVTTSSAATNWPRVSWRSSTNNPPTPRSAPPATTCIPSPPTS